jgi:hypothetical protein
VAVPDQRGSDDDLVRQPVTKKQQQQRLASIRERKNTARDRRATARQAVPHRPMDTRLRIVRPSVHISDRARQLERPARG